MARVLVVDYSRSGNTHKVAQAIAAACDADLERLRDARIRGGLRGWIRSAREAWRKVPAPIRPIAHDPEAYDLVILGSPVWAGHVSSPMRRYLQDQADKLGKIALFVTEGGRGGQKALAEMAALAGAVPVATLELREKDLAEALPARLAGFLTRIRKATSPERARRSAPDRRAAVERGRAG
jgi:flavodoxin